MKMTWATRKSVISLALMLGFWGGVTRAAPGPPAISPQPERAFTNNPGMTFVYINPGSFIMGSPLNESGRDDDERQHRVTLTLFCLVLPFGQSPQKHARQPVRQPGLPTRGWAGAWEQPAIGM